MTLCRRQHRSTTWALCEVSTVIQVRKDSGWAYLASPVSLYLSEKKVEVLNRRLYQDRNASMLSRYCTITNHLPVAVATWRRLRSTV